MITKANRILTLLQEALNESGYTNLSITSIYQDMPKSLPHVSVIEIVNAINYGSLDFDMKEETYVRLSYQIDIYAIEKEVVDNIVNIIDNTMREIHYRRSYFRPLLNSDSNIYRVTLRYSRNAVTANELTGGN